MAVSVITLILAGMAILVVFILAKSLQIAYRSSNLSKEMANVAFLAPTLYIVVDVLIDFISSFFLLNEVILNFVKYLVLGSVFVIYIFFFSKFYHINKSMMILAKNQQLLSNLETEKMKWTGYYNSGEFKDMRDSLLKLDKSIVELKRIYRINSERLVESVSSIKSILNNLSSYYLELTRLNTDLIDGLKTNDVFWNQISNTLRHQNDSLIRSIEQMEETTKLVEYLNDQINLVAINAAIEAAHAGEEGEGFILVADNIHNLSVQSRNSANTLNENIKMLSSDILIDQRELLEKTEKISLFLNEIKSLSNKISHEIRDSTAYLDQVDKSIESVIEIESELKSL